MKIMTFDIETTGLNPLNSKITCICARVLTDEKLSDEYRGSHTNEKGLIKDFFKWVSLSYEDLVISANGKDFDIPFILMRAFLNGISFKDSIWLTRIKHFDIINDITDKKISLNNLAKLYHFELKSGSGTNAIKLFEDMKLDELMEYCMNDVLLTEKVYLKYNEGVQHDGGF